MLLILLLKCSKTCKKFLFIGSSNGRGLLGHVGQRRRRGHECRHFSYFALKISQTNNKCKLQI